MGLETMEKLVKGEKEAKGKDKAREKERVKEKEKGREMEMVERNQQGQVGRAKVIMEEKKGQETVEKMVKEAKGAKEKEKEKERVVMRSLSFVAVRLVVKDPEVKDQGQCRNQEGSVSMKRGLVQSALLDPTWKRRPSQHGRFVQTSVWDTIKL